MRDILRYIVAVVCLVGMVCGGQVNACFCDVAGPETACASHDHSPDQEQGDQSVPDGHSDCPCGTCHFCPHAQAALPTLEIPSIISASAMHAEDESVAFVNDAADIFTPPKLV